MSVSATQIEQYHLCPFQYFCRYGLNLKERRPAEIDQLEYGSLIHYLLQQMFEAYCADEIVAMKDGQLFTQGTTQEMIKKDVLDELYEMDIRICEIEGRRFCLYF